MSQQKKRWFVPSEAAALARQARAGDQDAALKILLRFCEAIEREDQVPPEILGWIREAVRKYLVQKTLSLNDLLRLQPVPKGAQPDTIVQ